MRITITQPSERQIAATIAVPNASQSLADVDDAVVVDLIKQHGAILFRGFELTQNAFRGLAERFSTQFVTNRTPGRTLVSDDARIQTVVVGIEPFPLHPELSSFPWRPDICWFACNQPPTEMGETLMCDGIAVVKGLAPDVVAELQSHQFKYKQPASRQECEGWLGVPVPDAAALDAANNAGMARFSIEAGEYFKSFYMPTLHKPWFSDELAFGSFLLFDRDLRRSRTFPTWEDGSEVSDQICDEIRRVSDGLKVAHQWQTGDILMLDNSRVMHGRNAVVENDQRDIWTQFSYSSFVPNLEGLMASQPWRRAAPPR